MATKVKVAEDEKFQQQDFNLFEALAALDKKDYGYINKLTEEQQKKFVPFMMTHWMSCVKGNETLQRYYLLSTEFYANKHLLNENVHKHPKLQWMMLCASSPGAGKQFHQWIPHLSNKTTHLKETPKQKEVKEYFTKIYPKIDSDSLSDISETFIEEHKKKVYLAKRFPSMKQTDVEVLAMLVTQDDIKQYERDYGND